MFIRRISLEQTDEAESDQKVALPKIADQDESSLCKHI